MNLDRVFVSGLFFKTLSVEMKRSGSFREHSNLVLVSLIRLEKIPKL